MSPIGWCDSCNVPIIDVHQCGLCGSATRQLRVGKGDVKPVFDYEKEWYLKILCENGYNGSDFIPEGLCFYNRGSIIIDGKKVFRILFDEEKGNWKVKFFKKYLDDPVQLDGSDPQKVVKANECVLKMKEQESILFLQRTFEEYEELPKAVSFSGGKDSTVTLALARQLHSHIDVIFLNTTLAFPETLKYVHELTELWNLNLIEVKPVHDFFELCEKLGPPSRFMKWCCKTQKFAPMNKLINERYPSGVIVISGLRGAESRNRKNLERAQRNKLIPKQILVFPIYEWETLTVWLYLLWKKIPFNKLYEKGFSRLGCWACPEKSLKKLKLIEETYPKLMKKLYQTLRNFAIKEGLANIEGWIRKGKWRLRASKYKYKFISITRPCSSSDQFVYLVNDAPSMKQVEEFMKIFGKIEKKGGITRINNSQIQISIIGNRIHVEPNGDLTKFLPLFERQLEKALNCIHCGTCLGTCRRDALRLGNNRIVVSGDCTHCLECIKPKGIRKGCVALNYRPHLLSINSYLHANGN
jgi:phosphoadenosine phosphosulfate reductase